MGDVIARFAIGAFALATCVACGESGTETGSASPASDATVSFASDIVPILQRNCVACHLTGTEPGELSLTPAKAHAQLFRMSTQTNLPLVTPGDPDKSYLMNKIYGTQESAGGIGLQMPFGGLELAAEEIAQIETWILENATDN